MHYVCLDLGNSQPCLSQLGKLLIPYVKSSSATMTNWTFADSRPCLGLCALIWHFTSKALQHWTVREQMLYSECQWKRWEPISVNTWQLKLLLIKMPDCSRWVPFSTNRVSSWECHWKRYQIAADECLSMWKMAAETTTERDTTFNSKWETDWQLRQLKKEMLQFWMWHSTTKRTTDCSVITAFFSAAFHPSQDA